MGYELRVSTDDVAAKAATIQREAADLEARLAQLTSAMGALATTWTGSASSSFHELYTGWSTTARTVREQLEQIGQSLNAAGQDYASLESQLASKLR